MMSRYIQLVCLCCVALFMSACVGTTTSETHFYTLSPPLVVAKSVEQTQSIIGHNEWVSVSVQVPEHFRRPQLVLNTPDGTGVILLEQNRWASAFDDELHDAIISGIHQQFGQHEQWNKAPVYYRLKVSLLQMDTLLNDHVSANFHWSMTQKNKSAQDHPHATMLSCDFRANANISDGVQGAVKATQTIVQDLVNAIIHTIQMQQAGEVVAC